MLLLDGKRRGSSRLVRDSRIRDSWHKRHPFHWECLSLAQPDDKCIACRGKTTTNSAWLNASNCRPGWESPGSLVSYQMWSELMPCGMRLSQPMLYTACTCSWRLVSRGRARVLIKNNHSGNKASAKFSSAKQVDWWDTWLSRKYKVRTKHIWHG